MQLIGRDRIHQQFTDGTSILCELSSGNYQIGVGEDATIVTDLEQVRTFEKFVLPDRTRLVDNIDAWLKAGGVNRAQIEKRDLIMAEHASKQPGTFDALIAQLNDPVLAGQFHEMLTEAVSKKQAVPSKEVIGSVEGGVLVKGDDGTKEFIPNDAEMDLVLKAELALDAADDPARGEAQDEDDSVAGAIAEAGKATTRMAQHQGAKGKKAR